MGSLVVKLDEQTQGKLKNRYFYSDIDMLGFRGNGDGKKVQELPVVYDVEAVKQSVRNILMWKVGESILRPNFGNKLHQSLYMQMNQFSQDNVCQEIHRAIDENEPRVDLKTVAVKREETDGGSCVLKVRIAYTVVGNKTEDAKIVEDITIGGK